MKKPVLIERTHKRYKLMQILSAYMMLSSALVCCGSLKWAIVTLFVGSGCLLTASFAAWWDHG